MTSTPKERLIVNCLSAVSEHGVQSAHAGNWDVLWIVPSPFSQDNTQFIRFYADATTFHTTQIYTQYIQELTTDQCSTKSCTAHRSIQDKNQRIDQYTTKIHTTHRSIWYNDTHNT